MTQFQSLGQEDPLEEGMATHAAYLPRESHRQRSLEGYSSESLRVRHSYSMHSSMPVSSLPQLYMHSYL